MKWFLKVRDQNSAESVSVPQIFKRRPFWKQKKLWFGGAFAKILFSIILLVIIATWGKGPLKQDKIILIERGMGVRAIADKLYEEKVIYSRPLFAAGVLLAGHRSQLKAGEYAFIAGQNLASVISELVRGEILIRQLAIPEGLTVQQVVVILNNAPSLQGEINTLPAEGTLLPETYYYSWGDNRQDILKRMETAGLEMINKLWENREADIPLASAQQALVLASIVEKETGVAEERPRIAGVFYNRLRIGMKLQSDPTVIYGLSNGSGNLGRTLLRSDWKTPSPYNTYIIEGLPPAPISNPGRAALEAVLHPEKNDYLYFVATGTGGHAFARTLEEHNQNIVKRKQMNNVSAN